MFFSFSGSIPGLQTPPFAFFTKSVLVSFSTCVGPVEKAIDFVLNTSKFDGLLKYAVEIHMSKAIHLLYRNVSIAFIASDEVKKEMSFSPCVLTNNDFNRLCLVFAVG